MALWCSIQTLHRYPRYTKKRESEDCALVPPRLPLPRFGFVSVFRTWVKGCETINHTFAKVWIPHTSVPSTRWVSCRKSLEGASRESRWFIKVLVKHFGTRNDSFIVCSKMFYSVFIFETKTYIEPICLHILKLFRLL